MTGHRDNLFRRALEHHRAGHLDAAGGLYQKILQITPDHTDVLYLLAVIAHQTGQPAQAVELLRSSLAAMPDQARCYNLLGLNLGTLGMPDEAEASFRRAIVLDDSPDYYNNLGVLWKGQGRVDAAIGAYQQALARAPGDASAHYNLGNAYRAKGEIEPAAECFRGAAGSPSSDNQSILDARLTWAANHLPVRESTGHSPRYVHRTGQPLRIGYVSSFFQDHNWMKPVWGLINHHDRSRFEVHLFSDAPAPEIRHGYHTRKISSTIRPVSPTRRSASRSSVWESTCSWT